MVMASQQHSSMHALCHAAASALGKASEGLRLGSQREEPRLSVALWCVPRSSQIVQRCGADPVAAEGRPGLDIVYEDEHMACIVKPQGLPTQGKGEGSVQGRIK